MCIRGKFNRINWNSYVYEYLFTYIPFFSLSLNSESLLISWLSSSLILFLWSMPGGIAWLCPWECLPINILCTVASTQNIRKNPAHVTNSANGYPWWPSSWWSCSCSWSWSWSFWRKMNLRRKHETEWYVIQWKMNCMKWKKYEKTTSIDDQVPPQIVPLRCLSSL